MFCRLSPYSPSLISKTIQSSPEAIKLYQFFGIALQHSIQTFKTKKNVEQKELLTSQRSLVLSKNTQSQQKSQKTDILIQAASEELKEISNNCKQLQAKEIQKNVQTEIQTEKNSLAKPRKRIIRKTKKVKCVARVKKQQKIAKEVPSIRADLVTLQAIIPPVKGFSSRQILRRVEQLYKRKVLSWDLTDPVVERRKRFLKHLQ